MMAAGPRSEMLNQKKKIQKARPTPKKKLQVREGNEAKSTHDDPPGGPELSLAMITIGAQTSREDNRTMNHAVDLRKLLATHCKGPYSPEIDEFALLFRIGGELQEFDFEGCENIRRNRKARYIQVDIGFPSYRWKGVSDHGIRQYFAEAVETGLLCCIRRLEKDKTQIDSARLMNDFGTVKKLFLAMQARGSGHTRQTN